MLSNEKIMAVQQLVYEVDDLDARLRCIASFGAEELAYYLDLYNWDDGFAVPTAIANHPGCDQALALRLFWLADGLAWYTSKGSPGRYQQEWGAFCHLISDGILSGRFPQGDLSFDPGLSRVEMYRLAKSEIPEALYYPVVGQQHP